MDGSAQRGEGDPEIPSWEDARQAVMTAAEVCAAAVIAMTLRGSHGTHAAAMASQATVALRDLAIQLRAMAFDEAVIEAEIARAKVEALAEAGIPQPRTPHPHLHAV